MISWRMFIPHVMQMDHADLDSGSIGIDRYLALTAGLYNASRLTMRSVHRLVYYAFGYLLHGRSAT